ncbi:MAG: alpha-amylase family glycosyl hydrolase, partial [Planctomycetota bacterium]
SDQGWSGIRREDVVLYELHVGAFSEKGTFASAMNRLEELVELGITALEIMPVNECAGRWNWGYDGVDWFAPMSSLGTPDDFRRFVDRAHQLGLAVLLDVVYNHFGPEGNYLHGFGGYVSQRHHTTWGDAPNTDEAPTDVATRRFVVANALHWLDEYHLDGLRVDAIHCIADDSEPHLVRQMSEAIAEWSRSVQRQVLLVAESNVYDPEMLTPLKGGGMGFDAQWCDDFLHSVFAVVRPGEQLSHRPYLSKSDLSQVLTKGFVYEGTVRRERERKHPETRVDTRGLIYSIQNHDFIGNHPLGQRFHQLTCPATQRAAAALLILSPAIPMIFMGEEFACENPFSFFVDFGDDQLREAVVEGRKAEYPQHDWTNGVLPIDPDAFTSSKIGPTNAGSQGMLAWYQALIRIRREWIAAGVLSDHSLRVETFPDQDIHRLTYQTSTRTCGVSVRLGTPESAAPGHGPIGHAKRIDSSQSRYRNSDEPESSNQAIVFDTPAVT